MLTLGLRMGVIESELLYQGRLAYMTAYGGMYSHAKADIEKASEHINTMFLDAMGVVPYLTQGQTGRDVLLQSRMDAIREYEAYRKRMLKEIPDGNKPGRTS